ncbi:MAG: alpha/beta hydrolase family protein [Actinomycetota bacterium]
MALRSGSLTLEGHFLAAENPRAAVILLHGMPSGAPPDPNDPGYAGLAEVFAKRGYSALHFNFRGAHGAPGEFSLEGWAEDVGAALDAVAEIDDSLVRVLVGSSAGGAVAIRAASRRPDVGAVASLAAPAGYESITKDPAGAVQRLRNVGMLRDPAFPPDLDAWLREFEEGSPEKHAARIAPRHLLVIHGDADEVVPYTHAERIFAAAAEPKELVRISGGRHRLRRDERALAALFDWLDHLPIGARR